MEHIEMTEETEKLRSKKERDLATYPDRLIQVGEVCALTSLSRTQIHRLCNEPEYAHLGFPKSVPLGLSRRAWFLPAVRRWISERAAADTGQASEPSSTADKDTSPPWEV